MRNTRAGQRPGDGDVTEQIPRVPDDQPALTGPQTSSWTVWGGVAVLAAVLTVAVARVAWQPGRGLDPTDEASYLLATGHARDGAAFNGLFGEYTGMLLRLTGDDLGAFRLAGLAVVLVVFAGLGRAIDRLVRGTGGPGNALRDGASWLLPVGCAAAGLLQYSLFLRTPNYNWLALCGVALACHGLARSLSGTTGWRADWGTAALLGAGTFLAAWGKSTAGVGSALVVVVVVLVVSPGGPARRIGVLLRTGAVGLALLAVHVLFVLDLGSTVEAYRRSSQVLAAVDPVYYAVGSSVRILLDQLIALPGNLVSAAGWWLVPAALPLGSLVCRPARRAFWTPLVTSVAAAVTGTGLLVAGVWKGGVEGYFTSSLAMLAMVAVALVGYLVGLTSTTGRSKGSARRGLLALALLACAGAYGFGSNNGIVAQLTGAAGLILPAVFLLAGSPAVRPERADQPVSEPDRPVGSPVVAALGPFAAALAVCIAAATVLTQARDEPYRTLPLEQLTVPVDIGRYGGTVLVDPVSADVYRDIAGAASEAGWRPGTPLLDLSFTPSVAVVLDADVPLAILPLVGGFPTGTSSTVVALGYETADWRSSAWLLVDPTSATVDVAAVLASSGRTLDDYVQVISTTRPLFGELTLYRPRD